MNITIGRQTFEARPIGPTAPSGPESLKECPRPQERLPLLTAPSYSGYDFLENLLETPHTVACPQLSSRSANDGLNPKVLRDGTVWTDPKKPAPPDRITRPAIGPAGSFGSAVGLPRRERFAINSVNLLPS